MGITGLLPILKPIREQKHVKEFARTRVGVDAYGWLHKGIYGCAGKVCRGIATDVYVDYCMHRVRMLIHFGATPVLVFDGAALPMKAGTHAERRARREEALRKAEAAVASGNMRLAEEFYQRACPVTPEMARDVIRQCRKINVEYVVAPYEADAQLAWMMQTGFVDSVITEDSDLLVYGATRVFYKMNKAGEGDLYEMKNLPALDTISMLNFTEDMFVYMCVCSGCDFFKGVQGLGIRKSHAIVRKYRTMSRIIQAIRHDRRYAVTKSFSSDFARAFMVFRHQTVYDVRRSEMVHLNELDDLAKAKLPAGIFNMEGDGAIDLSFLGAHRDAAVAKRIAEGIVNPFSLVVYEEPLDIVERPVIRRKKRPRAFPEPPQSQLTSTAKEVARNVKGFQVVTAGGCSSARLTPVPNLKQRLTQGSRSFNPRRVAASFKARNAVANASNPNFSANVWEKFRRRVSEGKRNENEASIVTSGNEAHIETAMDGPVEDGSGEIPISDSHSKSGGERGNIRASESVETAPRKRPLSPDSSEDETKRLKLSAPAAHRVEAVNRAISRFASEPRTDHKNKFERPVQKLVAPLSPDFDGYELFERIDADLSRDPEDMEEPAKADKEHHQNVKAGLAKTGTDREKNVKVELSKNDETGTQHQPSGSKQVLLSRFFSKKVMEKTSATGSTDGSVGKLKPSALSKKSQFTATDSIRRYNSGKAKTRLKRGASGKPVGASASTRLRKR